MIGVDWGISQLRAYQIDANGTALEARTAPKGIMTVTDGDFASALESLIGDWLDRETEPALMCGMIGSRQGWVEAPYVACPATAEQVAGRLAEVTWGRGRRALICPGLTSIDADGVPDVMRGEEVQVPNTCTSSPTACRMSCAERKCKCSARSHFAAGRQ